MSTSRRLDLEQLEDRCVPATWGNPWPDAHHLTFSFAPDGTAVGDRTSELFRTLDGVAPTASWQREALRAFQTWAVQGNINIGLVPDGGQAFGIAGRPQGDSRFGDIRLAAYPLSSEVLAIATPFESTAGTWAGDVKLNAAHAFSLGGGDGTYDLYTILLHEAAHTFGLDHSDDSNSAVYATYLGPRTAGLTAEDIARLQALYGARTADRHEGISGNGTLKSATRLDLLSNPDGSLGIRVDGDITRAGDVDFYRFQAPLNAGTLNIRLQAEGISLLAARVTVYDSLYRAVGSAVSTDPLNNDLRVRIDSPTPLGTYYVKVEGATGDVFGIGSYRLGIESVPLLGATTSLAGSTTDSALELLSDDLHTDDTMTAAGLLPPLTTQTSSRFDYAFRASIRDSWDVDYYRVEAPYPPAGQANVLSVMVWGTQNNGLVPRAGVHDALGNQVEAEVLVNDNGIFTLQVRDAVGGATYYVKVEAADPQGPNNVGNYFLGIDFGTRAVELRTVTQGTLDQSAPEQSGTLDVQKSQMMHFVLSAEAAGASAAVGVRMTIYDAQGAVVATLTAYSGQDPVSLTQTLGPGTYTIRFTAFTADGSAVPQVAYALQAARLSDPIGQETEDTTEVAAGEPTSSDSTTSTSDDTSSTDDWYYWSDDSSMTTEDPYSDPYAAS